jgi:hypothetical protein
VLVSHLNLNSTFFFLFFSYSIHRFRPIFIVNTVHDTENEIIEQRAKNENSNSIKCDENDDKEINNNNHSFYLLKSEDKRDKNDNEMHNKPKIKHFSLNDDVVVMRTTMNSDKIKNHSTTTNNMESANEQEILIDKNDNIRQHDELVDCEIKKSSSSLIEIGDKKEISDVTYNDSEILKIETNVSVINNSIISSSQPQISNDTSKSKSPTIPLQIGESFSHVFNYFFLLFLSAQVQVLL